MSAEDSCEVFDLAIIGGGITGAGIARDAALRGLSCLLLEKGDFSSGASSKTTRLIHGGFKHLETGNFRLVSECLKERNTLLRLAPHLIYPIPILIPFFKRQKRKPWQIRADLFAYDLFGLGKATPRHAVLEKREALRRAPFLERDDLQKVGLIYDFQIFMPERLVLENIFSAKEHGSKCLNYHEVVDVKDASEGFEITVRRDDEATRRLKARVVVNASGPWADAVSDLYTPGLATKVFPVKSAHIVIDADLDEAVYGLFPNNKESIICLPLFGLTLVGAAETPWAGDPDEAKSNQAEIDRLLIELKKLLPGLKIRPESVLWSYSGVKPLAVKKSVGDQTATSERHIINREGKDGRFITVVGGKFTAFRKAAEETVDEVCRIFNRKTPCSTDREPLFGGGIKDKVIFRESLCECSEAIPNLPRETINHLVNMYGRRCCDLINIAHDNPGLLTAIAPGYVDCAAQVLYAVRSEAAIHLDDVILRRLSMGLTPDRGISGAKIVAGIMAKELNWNKDAVEWELERFKRMVARDMVFPSAE